jgi:pimeloyl-ACP methyl ester carboxylesterase
MDRGAWGAVVVAVVIVGALVAIVVVDPTALDLSGGPGRSGGGNGTVDTSYQVVDYTSSVDGAALSYAVWNPPGYTPTGTYAFLLFLHGVESTNLCTNVPSYAGGASMINAANSAGWIVGSVCTRVTNGWYANSPSTGPEETDVLDAIAHEKNVTHVSSVYLVGMSMGSNGALSIATNHPGLFQGVAGVAACPDMFELTAYFEASHGELPPGFGSVIGSSSPPSPGSVGYGIEYRSSAFRFYPQNLSGLRIYIDAGGDDQTCVDNAGFWPWLQANDTVLTSSCGVASSIGEPSDCSTPIAALAAAHPGDYDCRFVYEPTAPHTFDQLNGDDMVAFFLGGEAAGTYTASLGGTPVADGSVVQA